jgi:uncharacterized protein YjbI with pentapeptide repeats
VKLRSLTRQEERAIKDHNLWLASHGKRGRKANFEGADFSRVELGAVNLANANLKLACFSQAVLYGVNFSEAELSGADFTGARLEAVSLKKASLEMSTLSYTSLLRTNLQGARLSEAKLYRAMVGRSNMSRADISNVIVYLCSFYCTNLFRANLSWSDIIATDFYRTRFNDTNLHGVVLDQDCLTQCDFLGANISSAVLKELRMSEIENMFYSTVTLSGKEPIYAVKHKTVIMVRWLSFWGTLEKWEESYKQYLGDAKCKRIASQIQKQLRNT